MTTRPLGPGDSWDGPWKVARVDEQQITEEQRTELLGWITSLGVDPVDVRPVFAVSQDAQTRAYTLHLSRVVRHANGAIVLDLAANQIQIEPLTLPITDFPDWLPAVSHQQGVS